MPGKHGPALDRLLAKITIDAETGCWNWTAGKFPDGYGQFVEVKRSRGAHRVSYELHRGHIPKGMLVCHRCDNRGCINPDHLFLGTNSENMADMTAKSRQARGSSNGRAKLTEADVLAIKSAVGITQQELARQYGVGQILISRIRRGKLWAHLPGAEDASNLLKAARAEPSHDDNPAPLSDHSF